MKKIHNMIAAAAMFCVIIAILLTSFQAALYADPQYRFYEKEYEKYSVADTMQMKMEDVMEVTDYMMAYLIGEKEELSIETDVEGVRQDFFNEQDRLHMADVKNLFLGGLKLRNICLIICILLLVTLFLMKAPWMDILPGAYTVSVGIFLVAVLLLGVLFASDFNKYFTIFHEIFFTNDLWIFDPETDYMIRMLPEGFFYDMVMRIGAIFVGSLLGIWVIFGIWSFRRKKANKTENKQDL